ncbi:MAG: hypothetical protein WCT40_01905 [Candidatus Magasanikbacteria bacterium]|jgi:hypothetical protein
MVLRDIDDVLLLGCNLTAVETPPRFMHTKFYAAALEGAVMDLFGSGPEVVGMQTEFLVACPPETKLPPEGNAAMVLRAWRAWLETQAN